MSPRIQALWICKIGLHRLHWCCCLWLILNYSFFKMRFIIRDKETQGDTRRHPRYPSTTPPSHPVTYVLFKEINWSKLSGYLGRVFAKKLSEKVFALSKKPPFFNFYPTHFQLCLLLITNFFEKRYLDLKNDKFLTTFLHPTQFSVCFNFLDNNKVSGHRRENYLFCQPNFNAGSYKTLSLERWCWIRQGKECYQLRSSYSGSGEGQNYVGLIFNLLWECLFWWYLTNV